MSAYLDPNMLSIMREQATAQLTDSCTLHFPNAGVADGMGGTKAGGSTPSPVTYACRLQHVSSLPESEREGAEKLQADFYLVLPWDAVVTNAQYATVGSTRYDLRATSSPRTDAFTVRVPARRIGPIQ